METRRVYFRARTRRAVGDDTFSEKWLEHPQKAGGMWQLPSDQAHWYAKGLARQHRTFARVVTGTGAIEAEYVWKNGRVTSLPKKDEGPYASFGVGQVEVGGAVPTGNAKLLPVPPAR